MFLHLDVKELPRIVSAYANAFANLSAGDRMLRILGAEVIGTPTLKVTEAQAAASATVFYYDLRYSIPSGPFGSYSPHGIDVPLIFDHVDSAFAAGVFGFSAVDLPMAQRVHAAWVSFIKSGEIEEGLPAWPSYDLRKRKTMTIDREPMVSSDTENTERLIWVAPT
jgi:para-nitrobenzyl esterase